MKEINFSTTACRYCRFYKPEGRRGGACQMLGVSVQSSWKACNFASPPFDPTWKQLEEIIHLETSIQLKPQPKLSGTSTKVELKNNMKTSAFHQQE